MNPFKPDYERYEGVRPFNVWFLRVLFLLIGLFVSFDAWSVIVRHDGPWDPVRGAAWAMFASYSALSLIGVFRPLKMLPIMLFMITYKTIWLLVVAYPLWSAGRLDGSPAEGMAKVFIWVVVVYFGVPWNYVLKRYILGRA